MKVEIHCHTDRLSSDSAIAPRELVSMAEASGYDAVFITEHDRVWPEDSLKALQELTTKVKLFSGIEISLGDGVDVLVLGAQDPIYETLKTPDALLGQATADGLPTVIAHPYRWMDELPPYCVLADAVESRTCNHCDEAWIEAAEKYAIEHKQSAVYSSDAHGVNYMNKFWMETVESFETPQDFRRILLSGRFTNQSRRFSMDLPPSEKLASMAELSPEDQAALLISPAAQS